MNKKIIKSLSVFVSLFLLNSLLLITGIGIILSLFSKDSDYIKKKHGSIKVFSADLNHNGIIEDNEKNLTWSESFDKLLEQAGDFEELKKIADNMGIVESDKNIACKLARYEILHQCEELILKSGAAVPISTANFFNKKKSYLKGIYYDILGAQHFNRMYSTKSDEIKIVLGGPVTSLDQALISDANSHIKYLATIAGLKRYKFEAEKFNEEKKDYVMDTLEDHLGLVLKKLEKKKFKEKVKDKKTNKEKDEEVEREVVTYYVFLGKYQLVSNNNVTEEYFENIEFKEDTVTATSKIKQEEFKWQKIEDVKWQDNRKIVADDFIWSWNRIVDPLSKAPFREQFNVIDGYEEYSKKESLTSFDYYQGMKGLKKINDDHFEIQLSKYCPYFDSLLTSIVFFPAPRHKITENTGKKDEKIITGWWGKKECMCGCGPFKIEKFNNIDNGEIKLVKNDNYCFKDEVKIKEFTFELILSQTTAESKFNSGLVDYTDSFDRTFLDSNNEKELFVLKPYLNSRFFIFNVNRYNTFDQFIDDTYENISIEDREKIRQKMVKILYLLMPRYDACKNIFRGLDDSITGVVSNYMVEECIPEETSDGKIIAKRDENNKLKTAYWYERSRSEEITEETGEVFHIINKKKYKIKTTHFKTNLFCQRSIESAVSDKSGVYSYFYEKDKKFDDHMAEEVQRNNVNKAIELAAEIGIEYRHGKFTNFPKINFLGVSDLIDDAIYRIKEYLSFFGIDMDLSFIDRNSSYMYQDSGLYEMSATKWTADFLDPATWIAIFSSKSKINFFFTGNIED